MIDPSCAKDNNSPSCTTPLSLPCGACSDISAHKSREWDFGYLKRLEINNVMGPVQS